MPSRTLAGTVGLTGDWDLHEAGWKAGMDDNLLWLSVIVQGRVKSQVALEPGAPVQGDVYLLAATHATHPNAIAVYDEAAWHYKVPQKGWRLYNIALDAFVRFNGTIWDLDDTSAATTTSGGSGTIADGIVSGLAVVYSGAALTFNMTAGSFYLGGSLYSAAAQSVTLDPADATLPRIDTMYVTGAGVFGKVTGTPAATPVAPDVDPELQLFLQSVSVPAAATDLNGSITTALIYDENTEWPATLIGAHINAVSTTDPYSGTKSIEATAAVSGDTIRLRAGAAIAFGGDGNLLFRIKSKGFWNTGQLVFSWYLAGARVSNYFGRIRLRDRSFGFDTTNTADHQLISIPKSLFYLPSGTMVDELRIQVISAGGIGFFLDKVRLQTPTTGTTIVNITNGLTQDAADLLYFRLTGRALAADVWVGTSTSAGLTPGALFDAQVPQTLVDGANVTMNGNLGLNWEWDIAGNRNMLNPTNMKSGQSGTIRIKQDATGTRVVTWGANWEFPGGAALGGVLSTAANAVDYVSYTVSVSGKIRAVLSKAFSH